MKNKVVANGLPEPKKSLGDACRDALLSMGDSYADLFVLDAAAAFSAGKPCPDRYLNLGAAEQNLILTAAGMALGGFRVFAAAEAASLTGRAWEQIRSAVAIPGLPVRLVGNPAGITAGEDGAPRQMLEDIALMRALPNITLIVPADYTSAFALFHELAELNAPSYIRLGRSERPLIYAPDDRFFRIGGGRVLRDGDQITICACGIMVAEALKAAEILDRQDISAEVIDCYSLAPFPERLVLSSLQRTGCCVTAEEHFLSGGLFETVAGLSSRTHPVPVQPVGVTGGFGQSGSPEELQEYYGLTAARIVSAAVLSWTMRRPDASLLEA